MGLTNMQKGLLACGVGTAVVAAIMIPLSIYVIAPAMGQHALNSAVMNIPNSTVFDIKNPPHVPNNHAHIFNNVTLDQTSLPFAATMSDVQLVLNVPSCTASAKPGSCTEFMNWPQKNLAYFTMPEQQIKHGTNIFNATSDFTIFQSTDDFVHWALAMLFGAFADGIPLYIVGRPKLQALGIFHMDLTMGKHMNCTSFLPPSFQRDVQRDFAALQQSGEEITTDRLRDLMKMPRLENGVFADMPPITLTCEDLGEMDDDLIDEVLTNFTNDLAKHTTFTTSTTPTPRPTQPKTTAPATTATTAAATTVAGTTTAGATTATVTGTTAAATTAAVESISV
jgi:hypothetical protein